MSLKEMSAIQIYLKDLKNCLKELSEQEATIERIANIIFEGYKRDKQVFVLGNGGSASTASHCALGFEKQSVVEGKPRLKAKSLAEFSEQLNNQLEAGDVVIGISASGNSSNILKAIKYAKGNGAIAVGFSGFGGGKLQILADECIVLSCKDYGQVEDAHLALTHILSYELKEKISHG